MKSCPSHDSLASTDINIEQTSNSLLESILEGDRESITLHLSKSSTRLLQVLLTFTLENSDKQIYHDSSVLNDSLELLGPK